MLNPNETNYIQAGRSLLEIQIRRPIHVLSSCINSSTATSSVIKANKSIKSDLVTINGINFFPKEFAPSLNLKLDKEKQLN